MKSAILSAGDRQSKDNLHLLPHGHVLCGPSSVNFNRDELRWLETKAR